MIPLAVPNLAGSEARYLGECVKSNYVSSIGPFVDRFESEVAKISGSNSCVAVSSGTAALHLALTSIGVMPHDLVILPSLTFIASANAISHCGASPWLMDVSGESWTLNPEQLLQELRQSTTIHNGEVFHNSLRRRVSAILPVYTLGMPADMDAIGEVATTFGLPVVADAAAALGARYRNQSLGGLADVSVASFNGNKTFTCGGGGALFGNDLGVLGQARHLSATARRGKAYDHDQIGFNYRLTNLQAAVGVAQLEQSDRFLERKRQIDRTYRETIAAIPGLDEFPSPTWAQSACWMSGVVLRTDQDSGTVIEGFRQYGVEARTFWKPIHLQTPYLGAPQGDLRVTNSIWDRIITLPSSTSLTDTELDHVIHAMWEVLGE